MIRYTKEYINELLERFMDGETTVQEEDVLSEYFHTVKNVPEEWKDYQTMFAEWSRPPVQEAKRPLRRWAAMAAAAAVIALIVMVVTQLRQTEQNTLAVAAPADSTAVRPAIPPDTIAAPEEKPKKLHHRKRQPRVNDVARDYVLMAQREQERIERELEEAQAEVERVQFEMLDAQLKAQGYVTLRHEDGTIEYINKNEETEYYAYEPD